MYIIVIVSLCTVTKQLAGCPTALHGAGQSTSPAVVVWTKTSRCTFTSYYDSMSVLVYLVYTLSRCPAAWKGGKVGQSDVPVVYRQVLGQYITTTTTVNNNMTTECTKCFSTPRSTY